jgi:hypothetical protein
MNKLRIALAAVTAATSLVAFAHAEAASFAGPVTVDASMVTPVSGGCGPNGWRGPWGHCRYGGGWTPRPYYYVGPTYNGCPPGYWHGPWGHCRNTPYHGALPNGGWK